jgi:hypothetical protein
MATATEKTEMVTETREIQVEKVTGITLDLTLEEACHVAALVGCVSGYRERPGRAAANSIWRELEKVIRPNGRGSILDAPGYQVARESYEKIEIEA